MYNESGVISQKPKGPRVLLVDDSMPFLRNISSILRANGFDTATASSGITAVELVDSFNPQLVSLDYDMPGLDGIGTLLQIKQKLPQVKAIFISAYLDHNVVAQALANGADECIAKPVDLARMLNAVKRLTAYTS